MLTSARMVWALAWRKRDLREASREAFYATLARIPGADPAYERWRHPDRRIAHRDLVDLVVEGYPGSANSWMVHLITLANPGVRIADHRHRVAQVLEGHRQGLPTIVLIRQPLEAIASIMTRVKPLHPRVEMLYYRYFYETCRPALGAVVVATFDEVTTDPDSVIARVNARYGTGLQGLASLGGNGRQRVIDSIASRPGKGHAVPSEERAPEVARLRRMLSGPEHRRELARCEALYAQLAGLAE